MICGKAIFLPAWKLYIHLNHYIAPRCFWTFTFNRYLKSCTWVTLSTRQSSAYVPLWVQSILSNRGSFAILSHIEGINDYTQQQKLKHYNLFSRLDWEITYLRNMINSSIKKKIVTKGHESTSLFVIFVVDNSRLVFKGHILFVA